MIESMDRNGPITNINRVEVLDEFKKIKDSTPMITAKPIINGLFFIIIN